MYACMHVCMYICMHVCQFGNKPCSDLAIWYQRVCVLFTGTPSVPFAKLLVLLEHLLQVGAYDLATLLYTSEVHACLTWLPYMYALYV